MTCLPPRSSLVMRAAIYRAVLGTVIGILGGGLALAISLGRAGLLASGGRGPALAGPHQIASVPALLVAFGLYGALVGLLAPLRRTAAGAFALAFIAAGGFVTTVLVGLAGLPARWPAATWLVAGIATLVLASVLSAQLQPPDA